MSGPAQHDPPRDGAPQDDALAVALAYEGGRAPRVVAKGRGDVGRAILEAARAHGVPLERDPVLAEALSQVELEREIPRELYRAVAVVIGFVVKSRTRRARRP